MRSTLQRVRQALQQVDACHLLTRQQEHFLAHVAQIGKHRASWAEVGTRAKNILVSHNIYLAANMAGRYRGRVPIEDLVQEATVGLLAAADRFDHRRHLRFSSYAAYWIKKYVLELIYNDALIRLPHSTWFRNSRRRPKCLDAMPILPTAYPIDPASIDISPWPALDEDVIVSKLTAACTIGSLWVQLSPMEAEVLSLRYGVGVPTTLSTRDIAQVVSRDRTTIYSIEQRALSKMRAALAQIEAAAYGTISIAT